MDAYSGTEWRATGDGSVVAGEYLRVGAEIPTEGHGEPGPGRGGDPPAAGGLGAPRR